MAGKSSTAKLPQTHRTAVHRAQQSAANWAWPAGFGSALLATIAGIVYFLVMVGLMLAGEFTFPPAESVQLFGGIISLIIVPILVALMACLHTVAPLEKKAFSQCALAFTLLFAMAVSANRFTQLGVVRQSQAAGVTEGIGWFLAYGERSVMFGLEILGWGGFLGLAILFAAPLFSGGKLQLWLRWLCVLYGILGLTSAVAFLIASPLSVIGFAAWGLVLFVITGLLAILFRQKTEFS